MTCLACGDSQSALYSACHGDAIIDLCLKCAGNIADLAPVKMQSQECRECGAVGRCCRTKGADNGTT